MVSATMLTQFCNRQTTKRQKRRLVVDLYKLLTMAVIDELFPKTQVGVYTPMMESVGVRSLILADLIDDRTKVAIATPMRAGDLPANTVHDFLENFLGPDCVRQDYQGAGRMTDDNHRVTGTRISYRNIGPLENRFLLIPDPMGATGGTILQTIEDYGAHIYGCTNIVVMHLITCPEYIHRITTTLPQVQIFVLRVDRGMSDPDVLASVPGTFRGREFGLNEKDYLVPGGGDIGEGLTGAP